MEPQTTKVPRTSERLLDWSRTCKVALTPLSDELIHRLTRGSAVENTSTWHTHETRIKTEHSHVNVLSTVKTEPLDTYEEINETAVSNTFDAFHERFNCSMCYKDFFDNESFVIHKYTEHNAHRFKPYMCQICDEKFLLSAHLNFHMSKHGGVLRKLSSSTLAIDYHPSSESNLTNKNNLKKSSKKSKHENGSTQIYSQARIKPFKCPNCTFASKSETKFMQHQLTCSTIDKQTCTTFPDNSSEPECYLCGKTFMNKTALNGHMRYHSLRGEIVSRRQYALNIGNQENIQHRVDNSEKSSNTRKTDDASKMYKCKDCTRVFISLRKLFIHYQQHKKQMLCNICNKQFFLYKRYQKHLLKHETDNQIKQTCTTFPDNSSEPECYLCGKTFMNKTALNGHMRYHSLRGEIVSRRQYALNIGNQENIQHRVDNSEKSSNTRKTDDASKMYKCKDCTRVFISRRKLFIHYQQHKKQMLCNICNKQFFLYKRYQNHLLKHETDNQINYNNSSTLLDNQEVSEYKSVPKTNRSKVKIINSKRPDYLKPQKPFQCEQCKNYYSSKKSLAEHVRLYHKLAKKKCVPKMASTPCNWCRAVITTNNLHRHVKTCHPTVKSLSCTQCTSKFRDFPSLKLHISEFHKNKQVNQI